MRLAALVLWLGSSCIWAAADPALTQIKAVYLMPMASGLDQYMATRLTEDRVFDVVTDPALADAVITDRIGHSFEQALADLYPPPPAEKPKEEKPKAEAETAAAKVPEAKPEDSKAAKAAPYQEQTLGAALADRPDVPRRVSTFNRGRGSVFVVDRRTKRVLWSDFRPPKNSRPNEVNKAATRLADQLQRDLEQLRTPQK
jgi:hypothetical protein